MELRPAPELRPGHKQEWMGLKPFARSNFERGKRMMALDERLDPELSARCSAGSQAVVSARIKNLSKAHVGQAVAFGGYLFLLMPFIVACALMAIGMRWTMANAFTYCTGETTIQRSFPRGNSALR